MHGDRGAGGAAIGVMREGLIESEAVPDPGAVWLRTQPLHVEITEQGHAHAVERALAGGGP